MEAFQKAIFALNDPTRVKILAFLIAHQSACVCEIEASLGILQSTLSRHLKILHDGGFLAPRRVKTFAFYDIAPRSPLHQTLLGEVEKLSIDLPEKAQILSACAVA
ncbi:MAG: ArsR/SmtB family transcription factor [Campylobacterales bacterium]